MFTGQGRHKAIAAQAVFYFVAMRRHYGEAGIADAVCLSGYAEMVL